MSIRFVSKIVVICVVVLVACLFPPKKADAAVSCLGVTWCYTAKTCPTEFKICDGYNPDGSCGEYHCDPAFDPCDYSRVAGASCNVSTNCGPANCRCGMFEDECSADGGSDPGPTPTPGGGGGGGGGCGAQCNSVADCSIGGAQNPACSGGVCWDAQACGGGGGGNNCDFQFTCDDGRVCGEGEACRLTSEGTWTCSFRTECAVCGDGRCTTDNGKESCNSCAIDCGLCPGTLRGRAMIVTRADTSCVAVAAAAKGLDNTKIKFTKGNNSYNDKQDGKNYVVFSKPGGTYTIEATPDNNDYDYTVVRACWGSNMGTPLSGEGTTQQLSPDEILTWNIGVVPPGPWYQVTGGDVYARTTLRSYIASGASPRDFILDGDGKFPGLAQYGILYDFDSSSTSQGENLISTTNWLVHSFNDDMDLYDTFYNKLGAPTTVDTFANLNSVSLPAGRATPYYVVGDVTTSGNWSVGSGQNVIMIINGNLNINGKINVSGSGFLAFVVKGNISIAPTVGHPYGSSSNDVEGILITSGAFQTGASAASAEQLTVRGTVVAQSVFLQRDLESVGKNQTLPAENFIYNPQLMLLMPESLKDTPVFWQEVAP